MYIVLWKIYYINISLIFFLIYVFILNFKKIVQRNIVLYDKILYLEKGKDVIFGFCGVLNVFDRVWNRGLLFNLKILLVLMLIFWDG